MELIDIIPEFNLYEEFWKIYTNSAILPPQYIAENAVIDRSIIGNGCEIYGEVHNCVISAGVTIEEGAVVRDSIIMSDCTIGKGCVIGNSTELKNVIIFDNVQVPHYNYVGDSILGFKSHMGAGSITSNVKSDKTLVHVKGIDPETNEKFDLETGLKKFGAMLGNHVEVGCNSVLNPGTVIGSNSNVYPLSPVRGFVPAESIYKTGGVIVKKHA